jgi:hypothetical protein
MESPHLPFSKPDISQGRRLLSIVKVVYGTGKTVGSRRVAESGAWVSAVMFSGVSPPLHPHKTADKEHAETRTIKLDAIKRFSTVSPPFIWSY